MSKTPGRNCTKVGKYNKKKKTQKETILQKKLVI